MYSNKDNINILTSLLVRHGVVRAVVCPGSRNAPIVHNFSECPDMQCFPVTDERSAGFYALGMALATGCPVAVCVTSGTALLNLMPAVAEAFHLHVPLVVVSADRPQAWIGQLDGQTLPQAGALGCFVGCSVTLPEPLSGGPEPHRDEAGCWYCGRLVNEAMMAAGRAVGCPVHINVPVSEPLFEFSVSELPDVHAVRLLEPCGMSDGQVSMVAGRLLEAARPMVIVGRHACCGGLADALRVLGRHAVVLREPLCPGDGVVHFDEVLHAVGTNPDYMPDFILYAGDTIVSKRLKRFLRSASGAETWAVSADGKIHDTFMNQTVVMALPAEVVFGAVASYIAGAKDARILCEETEGAGVSKRRGMFIDRWRTALSAAAGHAATFEPRYSQMMAVRLFESMLGDVDYDCHVHYANSSAVRLGNIYADHYIYVNRGVNGIEGSLSTAAGFSVANAGMTFCVIGDLSFFYVSNALWNRCLRGNLRVLLLNNCGGGIFHQLPGLDTSPVRDSFIAAGHNASAHGICDSHDIGYLSARNAGELSRHMETFLYSGTNRPLLFEVFTDAEEDAAVMREYYSLFKLCLT